MSTEPPVTPADPSGPAPTLAVDETLEELPETPEGWRRRLTLHLNLGGGVGAGTYEVLDPEGRAYPFAYCYRAGPRASRGDRFEGFFLTGDVCDAAHALTWPQLRRAWPRWRAANLYRPPAPKG